jgi:hypothetical protein
MSATPILPFDEKPIGHNSGGDPEAIRLELGQAASKFVEGLDVWLARGELTADTAPRARDFIAGAKKLLKEADAARRAEKAPHEARAKEVDAAWKPIAARITAAIEGVTPLLDAFGKAEQARKLEIARAAQAKADAAEAERRAAAEEAARAQTESQRIAAQERADAAAAEAAAAERAAQIEPTRIESATGLANRLGARKVWDCEVEDLTRAILHFRKHDPDAVRELVVQLSKAALRTAPTVDGVKQVPDIPGVRFTVTEKFA